jgi:hypothetical protein
MPINATPSASTVGSTTGAFLATTFVILCDKLLGIDFPAGYEAGLAAFLTTLGGYIPDLFRKVTPVVKE